MERATCAQGWFGAGASVSSGMSNRRPSLALTDAQLKIVLVHAGALSPEWRGRYLEGIAG
jgi:hypothetical protein